MAECRDLKVRVAERDGNLGLIAAPSGFRSAFDHSRFGGKPLNLVFINGLRCAGSGLLVALVYRIGHAKMMGYGALGGLLTGGATGLLELRPKTAQQELVARQLASDEVNSLRGAGVVLAWQVVDTVLKGVFTAFVVGAWKRVGSVAVPFLSCCGVGSLVSGSLVVALRPRKTVECYATETPREKDRLGLVCGQMVEWAKAQEERGQR